MRRSWRAAVAVVLTAVLSVGCTARDCTAIGAESGVSFDLRQIVQDRSRPVHVRACVQETCVEHVASSGRWDMVFVNDPRLSAPGTVPVQLTLTSRSGRTILDATTDVAVRMFQPNGPGCDPTVYVGAVVVTSDGNLGSPSGQSG